MAKIVCQVGPVAVVIKDDRAKLNDKRAGLWARLACDAARQIAESISVEETEEVEEDGR